MGKRWNSVVSDKLKFETFDGHPGGDRELTIRNESGAQVRDLSLYLWIYVP